MNVVWTIDGLPVGWNKLKRSPVFKCYNVLHGTVIVIDVKHLWIYTKLAICLLVEIMDV